VALGAAALAVHGNTAVQPVPRDPKALPPDPHWMERHESFVEIAKRDRVDVLFLGDSITDFWRCTDKLRGGKAVWDANFAPLNAANFGIGADRTQHLLWRMQHGELDGIKPKAIVLLIGTNNIGFERDRPTVPRNTPAEAVEGVTAVVKCLRAKLPDSRILLMALFPRGEKADPIRDQVREVNAVIARLDDGTFVRFLDVGAKFLQADGTISKELMPDLLHPSEKGYEVWAAAIKEPLAEFLKSQPRVLPASVKPNVVFIMCDDLGWGDVGFHGSSIATPNIDKLAREGVELTQYYVSPVCTPSRAGLMTGRYWTRFGVYGVQAIRSLPFDTVTLPRALKSAGYDTAMMGKWHLGSRLEWGPNHFGFDYSYGSLGGGVGPFDHFYKVGPYMRTWHRNNEFITEDGHVTDLIGNDVVRWIARRRDKDAPFFLYVPFTAPHVPIKEPQEWLDRVSADFTIKIDFGRPSPFPPAIYSGIMARQYAACVMHMDYEVGRIVRALEEAGKRENTIVVFTSDNGAPTNVQNSNEPYPVDDYPKGPVPGSNLPLRGVKGGLYEGGIHVVCVVNWPGKLARSEVRQPMDIVDWMPTFCALAGYKPDRDLKWDGMDVWPFLASGSARFLPRLLYCGAVAGQELREGDWKLIMPRAGRGQIGSTELYDLANDPFESIELALRMPEKVQWLKRELAGASKADGDSVVPDREAMLKEFGPTPGSNEILSADEILRD
jgi:arylsulfatase A-like enzyme/lysophospholipase L1-like esterase